MMIFYSFFGDQPIVGVDAGQSVAAIRWVVGYLGDVVDSLWVFFVDAHRKRVLVHSDDCLELMGKAFLREGSVVWGMMDLEVIGISWELLQVRIAQAT